MTPKERAQALVDAQGWGPTEAIEAALSDARLEAFEEAAKECSRIAVEYEARGTEIWSRTIESIVMHRAEGARTCERNVRALAAKDGQ